MINKRFQFRNDSLILFSIFRRMSKKSILTSSNYFCVDKGRLKNFIMLIFLMVMIPNIGFGQNIDNILNSKPLSASSSLIIGTSFYNSQGIEGRRNPFAYYISASPTITIYGIDLSFNFTYRDQQGSLSHPFNRFNFNPSYKWISVGIGKTSLNLSPYTLSGQIFSGVSIELTPGKFRFKAIQGNLENPLAQIDSLIEGPLILPTYKRRAYAVSLGFGSGKNYIDVIAFHAKDDINNSDISQINHLLIHPEENLVLGSKFAISVFNHFEIRGNVAASGYTSNLQSSVQKASSDIITTNISTKVQFAGDASINYFTKQGGVGIEYKRVDPLYKSLGTYYFLEDYQNLTLNLHFTLLKKKVRFTGSAGVQENNISRLRAKTRRRTIFNGNLMIAPIKTFNTSVRVSNFQSTRTPVLSVINDSIKFVQTTENYGLVSSWILPGKSINTTLVMMANYQQLVDLGLDLSGNRGVENYIMNLSCNLYLKQSKMGLGFNLLANQNQIGRVRNARYGMSMTANKKFLDKRLSLASSIRLTNNYIADLSDGFTWVFNVNARYKVKKAISISLNSNVLSRSSKIQDYSEYRTTFKVSYHFNTSK